MLGFLATMLTKPGEQFDRRSSSVLRYSTRTCAPRVLQHCEALKSHVARGARQGISIRCVFEAWGFGPPQRDGYKKSTAAGARSISSRLGCLTIAFW